MTVVLPLVQRDGLPRNLPTLGRIGTDLGRTHGRMLLRQAEVLRTRRGLSHPIGTLVSMDMIPLAGFDGALIPQMLLGM